MAVARLMRALQRHHQPLAIGALIALAVHLLIMYHVSLVPPRLDSRKHDVGVGSAAVLIDSYSSQVVDLGKTQSRADVASLTVRAQLLADLLAASPLKERIAERAGIDPETLIAVAPTDSPGAGQKAGPASGATVDPNDPRASALNISVRDAAPIITVVTKAPTKALAAALANSAVHELGAHLDSLATDDRVPDDRRLVVDPLGEAHSATVTRGPSRPVATIAALLVFAIYCGAFFGLIGFVRGWQRTAKSDWDGEDPVADAGPVFLPPRPSAVHVEASPEPETDSDDDDVDEPDEEWQPPGHSAVRRSSSRALSDPS